MIQHAPHPNRSTYATRGNTLTEYAFIVVLVLVVVFGGLSVVGKRLGEYMGGLKDDMAHHQQLAEHRTRGITDFSLMPVGKTRTITLSNGQIVTLTYGKNTINVSGANGDSYDIPLDRSKADPTLLLSGGKLALQYGDAEAGAPPIETSFPGSNTTNKPNPLTPVSDLCRATFCSGTSSVSHNPGKQTQKNNKKDTKPKKKNKQHSNNGDKTATTKAPSTTETPSAEPRPLPYIGLYTCNQIKSGTCVDSTRPGLHVVEKTAKGDLIESDASTASGSK